MKIMIMVKDPFICCSILSRVSISVFLLVRVKERQNESVSCHIVMLACFSVQFCFSYSVIKFLGLPHSGKPYDLVLDSFWYWLRMPANHKALIGFCFRCYERCSICRALSLYPQWDHLYLIMSEMKLSVHVRKHLTAGDYHLI